MFLFMFLTQVLEKMQKADKTHDDVYEEFVMNFKKQEVLKSLQKFNVTLN